MKAKPLPETESIDAAELGAMMREMRENLGHELETVASDLRIRLVYLEAIEAGRLADLPGNAYVSGFLRSYSDFLGLEGDEIVRRFKMAGAEISSQPQLHLPSPVEEGRLPTGSILLVAAVIAAAAYGGWYYLSAAGKGPIETVANLPKELSGLVDGAKNQTAATQVPNISPAPTVAPAPDAPAAEVTAPVAPAGVAEESGNGSGSSTTPQASDAPSAEAPVTAAAPETPAAPVQPSMSDTASAPAATGSNASADAPEAPVPAETASTIPVPVPAPAPSEVASSATQTVAVTAPETPVPAPQIPAAPAREETPAPAAAETPAPMPVVPPVAVTPASSVPETPVSTEQVRTVAVSSSADEPASSVVTPGNTSAAEGGVRIVVRATADSYVAVRTGENEPLFSQLMRSGDSYEVPSGADLVLETGNAGGLQITIGGKRAPSLGPVGQIRRNIPLDAEKLLRGLN